MTVYNAKDYKLAKIVAKDLAIVVQLILSMDTIIKGLMPYRRYKYVNSLIEQFLESKSILEIQLKKYENLKNKKGQV